MHLPDFIIIGAAKAGTTSLYKVLAQHPDIFMSTPKEPEFFARDDRYAAGVEHYSRLFDAASSTQICGEASTLYSLAPLFPYTAERIKTHLPQVKLIYILREPVARAYSYYVQLVKNRQNATQDPIVHRSFEDCLFPDAHPDRAPRAAFFAGFDAHLPDDPALFLAGSDYVQQIDAYLAHFDRAQIHFVVFEEFMARPAAAIAAMLHFLGVDPARLANTQMARANISEDHFDRVRQTAEIGRVRQSLGPLYAPARLLPKGLKRAAKQLLMQIRPATGRQDHMPPAMLPATRDWLHNRFLADRHKIQALTDLDLAVWDAR